MCKIRYIIIMDLFRHGSTETVIKQGVALTRLARRAAVEL